VTNTVVTMKQGLLKLKPISAHLERNEGNFLDRMSPFVIIKINGFEVFRNEPQY